MMRLINLFVLASVHPPRPRSAERTSKPGLKKLGEQGGGGERLLILCVALLALFLGTGVANAQAVASPCAVHQGQVGTAACAEFLTYLRDSSRHWSESTSVIVPESTMGEASTRYVSQWDDNDVAYIPESSMGEVSARYVHHWDDNDVAYIPESTMDVSVDEVLSLHQTQEIGN